MKGTFRRYLTLIVLSLFLAGIVTPAFAASASSSLTPLDVLALYPNYSTQSDGYNLTSCTITDSDTIQALANSGYISPNQNGKLPTSVTIELYSISNQNNAQYYARGNSYISPYDYEILPGPDEPVITLTQSELSPWQGDTPISQDSVMDGDTLSAHFSATGTATWTTTMTKSIEVSGKLFTVADLKGSVSTQLGVSIGASITVSKTITTTAPANMQRILSVYIYYGGIQYTGKVNGVPLGTGKAWKPMGLIGIHADYPIENV